MNKLNGLNTQAVIAGLAFIVCLVLTIDGLIRHQLFDQFLWSETGSVWWAFIASLAVLSGFIAAHRSGAAFSYLLMAGPLFYVLSVVGATPIFAVLVILATAYVIGSWVTRALGCDQLAKDVEPLLKTVAGLAAISALMQYAVQFPINYRGVYLLLVGGVLLVGRRQLLNLLSGLRAGLRQDHNTAINISLASGLLLFAVMLNVVFASKPEVGHDALGLHLWIPDFIAQHGHWHFDVRKSVWSVFPMAANMQFTLAYLLGGEYAARLINVAFVLITAVLLYRVIRRRNDLAISKLLIAVFLSTPLIGLESGSLFVEHFWVLLIFSAMISLTESKLAFQSRWMLCTLLLAAAMATKVMTVFVLPVFAVTFVWECYRNKIKPNILLRTLGWAALLMTIIGGYPYFVALYKTGNPVFPAMNHIFQSEYFNTATAYSNSDYNQGYSPLTLIYDLTFDSRRYLESLDGAFGFVWMLFLAPSLLLFGRRAPLVVLLATATTISMIAGIFSQQAYLRYIMPTLPMVIIIIGYALSRVQAIKTARRLALTSLFLTVSLNAWFFSSASWTQKHLVLEDSQQYIARHAPERLFNRYLNTFAPDTNVLNLERFYPIGLQAETVSANWYFPDIPTLETYTQKPAFLNALARHRIGYVIGNHQLLAQHDMLKTIMQSHFDIEQEVGQYFLARLKDEYRFSTEMLKNRHFEDGLTDWRYRTTPEDHAQGLQVSLENHLHQLIEISPGESYKISYTVDCPEPVMLRLQVNWMTRGHGYVNTSFSTRLCDGSNMVFDQIIKAPEDAQVAAFFVGTNDEKTLFVHSVSMLSPSNPHHPG